MQQIGHNRFPGPLRGGKGLLGHAPPGFGHPPGVPPGIPPPPGLPPPGMPPPHLEFANTSVPPPGFPRVPPPNIPPPMAAAMSQQSQLAGNSGLTSAQPDSLSAGLNGTVSSKLGGLLANMTAPNLAQPPPPQFGNNMSNTQLQSHPLMQQQQQQIQQTMQQQAAQGLSIPGTDSSYNDLQQKGSSNSRDSALALVNQLLQGSALGTSSLTVPGAANLAGLSNPAVITPNLSVPPPGHPAAALASATQMSNTHSTQQQVGNYGNMTPTVSMGNINSMMSSSQQYTTMAAGNLSAVTSVFGSTAVGGCSNLTQNSAIYSSNTRASGTTMTTPPVSGTVTSPPLNLHTPPPSAGGGLKQPLLGLPPGINPNIPPPNHPHAAATGQNLLPNPGIPNMYPSDVQQQAQCQNLQQQQQANNNNFQRPTGLLGNYPAGSPPLSIYSGVTANQNSPSPGGAGVYRLNRPRQHHHHSHPYQHHQNRSRYDYRDTGNSHRGSSDKNFTSYVYDSMRGKGKNNGQKSEEYDPAEPTEDSQNDNGSSFKLGKRARSPSPHGTSDLTVTINSKGRSVSQDGRPLNKKLDSGGRNTDKGKFYCHACNIDSSNLQAFDSHMQSEQHLQQIQNMTDLLSHKTDQQLQRMKAEEHIKRIEGKDIEDYCRICDKKFPNKFPGAFIAHRRSQEHRRKERLTKRGCKLCDTGSFPQYPEYVKHIDSEPHKKKKELLRSNNESMSSRTSVCGSSVCGSVMGDDEVVSGSVYGEEETDGEEVHSNLEVEGHTEDQDMLDGFPDNIDDMVTVDATGIYRDDQNEEAPNNREGNVNNTDTSNISPAAKNKVTFSSIQPEIMDSDVPVSKDVEDNAPWRLKLDVNDGQPSLKETILGQTNSSTLLQMKPVKPSVKIIDPNSLVYDPHSPIGVEQIVPVTGFFCKLCHKFYNSESTARINHCQSATHFDKYKSYLTNLLKKEANKVKSTSPVNGKIKDISQNSSLQDTQTVKKQVEPLEPIAIKGQLSIKPVKDFSIKDIPINTDPLVCKLNATVKRTIQVKPDDDIKVDVNANPDIDPSVKLKMSTVNNNNKESLDNELNLEDDRDNLLSFNKLSHTDKNYNDSFVDESPDQDTQSSDLKSSPARSTRGSVRKSKSRKVKSS